MNCLMCRGKLENKKSTFLAELDGTVFVVKNVPSQVCPQCGEISYSSEVAKQLQNIIGRARSAVTEIAVINYVDAA